MQATPAGRATAWTLLVILGVANIAGYAFDLYAQFWWFDRVLHACTILAVTLWLAIFVFGRTITPGQRHGVLVVLLLASLGIALGALWEVAEWGFDRLAPGDVIKGKHDTIIDIIMDTAGAVMAAVMALNFMHRPAGTGQAERFGE